MPKETTDEFITKFNALLGNRTGRHATAPLMPNYSQDAARKASTSALLEQMVKAQSQRKPAAKKREKPKEEKKSPFTKKVLDAALDEAKKGRLTEILEEETGRGFGDTLPGKAFEGLMRIGMAPTTAMAQASKALVEGENPLAVGDDALYGLLESARGRKEGFGEVLEQWRRKDMNLNPITERVMGASPQGRTFVQSQNAAGIYERDAPELYAENQLKIPGTDKGIPLTSIQTGQRATGLVGDLGFDPFNAVGGVVRPVSRATNAVTDSAGVLDEVSETVKRLAKEAGVKGTVSVPQGPGLANRFVSRIGKMSQDVRDVAENAVLEVNAGAKRGTLNLGGDTFGPVVSAVGGQKLGVHKLEVFEDYLNQYKAAVAGNTPLDSAALKAMSDASPAFKSFLNDLPPKTASGVNKLDPIKDWNELRKRLRQSTGSATRPSKIEISAAKARSSITDEVANFQKKISDAVGNPTYNAPGIRVGSKELVFKRIGKAYDMGKQTAKPKIGDAVSSVSYKSQFPGRLSTIGQSTKGLGVKEYEDLFQQVRQRTKDTHGITNRAARKRLQYAIEDGTEILDNPVLEAERQWLMEQYRLIHAKEVEMGVRNADDFSSNYAYVFNQGGRKQARTDFKKQRKEAIRGKQGPVKYLGTAEAKKRGLRPVEDAYEALLLRKMKSNRDLTRAWFKSDIMDHYGILSKKLSVYDQTKRGLQEIGDLPKIYKTKADEAWYLPKEMNEIVKKFGKLSTMNNSEAAWLVRSIDSVINKWKALATLPFPGFHIRNMIGDILMGFLDGVRGPTYTELLRKKKLTASGKRTTYRLADGVDISHDELIDLYTKNAASGGFYATDINPRKVMGAPARVVQKARDISEYREDFGRIAHFLHALRDEYPSVMRKVKDPEMAKRRAVEAAVYRVNQYKFDYGALTAFEKNYMKRIMPFYTYTRKAIPTLMESFYLSPRQMSRVGRVMDQRSGDDNNSNFMHMMVPQYHREIGYAGLTDEEEPWIMNQSMLPTGVLGIGEGEDLGARLRSILSSVNPAALAPIEMAAEKQFFTEAPIENNLQYLLSKLPPYQAYQSQQTESARDKSLLERIASSRLGGLSVDKISNRQQGFALQDLRDQSIDEPIRKFNDSNPGLRLYFSERKDASGFVLKDTITDQILFEESDIETAFRLAQKWAEKRKE
jgi:hypothetical protein